jgi:hypothetical protein
VFTGANLSITARDLTVTADAKSKIYGNSDPALTYMHGALYNGDTNSVFTGALTRAAGENVGTYAISQGTLTAGSNYNILFMGANLTITPRPAAVTPNAASKVYGSADPALTGTLSGFLAGDGVTATYSRTAGEMVLGSPYTISATLSPAGVLSNYSITYNTANFTITPKAATVTAANKSKAYLAPNPTLTAAVTGTVNGDTLSYTLATTATQTSVPGTYPITVTLGSNPNYSVTKTDGTLTIGYGTCTGPNGPGGVILQPLNADGSSVVKQGSTVPVKFTVCDANGNPISDPMAVFGNSTGSITLISAVRGTIDNVNETVDNDIPDVAFRYSSGIWIFNMATNNLTKNTTYTYHINLKVGTINFSFGTK